MARFLTKRLLNMVPLIIGITFVSFLVMSLAPGNFLTNLKLNPAISPQVIHQFTDAGPCIDQLPDQRGRHLMLCLDTLQLIIDAEQILDHLIM